MKINRRSAAVPAVALLALLSISMASAGASSGTPASKAQSTRTATEPAFSTVSGGEVMGAKVDGVYQFKGIPYASVKRFEKPQAAAWDGIKKALSYGEVCPNGADKVNSYDFAGPTAQDMVENENCLNLNVWSTSTDPAAKKPVVVWIHGGGLSSGSSGELAFYDGHNFAEDEDVVFVSLNSRLNVLGYLDLSGYGDAYTGTGNLGQLDQVAALEWVQKNISLFGGDPSAVTIIGQSGGAAKVEALMAMPSAQGLFQRAVAMSGSVWAVTQDEARASSAKVFQKLGISKVEELKALPYDEILVAAKEAGFVPGIVIDGSVVPVAPVQDGVFSPISKNVPLLTTNNFGEFSSNVINATGFDVAADPLKDVYKPELTPGRVQELLDERFGVWKDKIVGEFQKQFPNHDVVDVLYMSTLPFVSRTTSADPKSATAGGAPVYSALFAWELPFFGGTVSYHTSGDLPFIFDNTDKIPALVAGAEKEAQAFSDVTSSALANFVRTGNPGGAGKNAWPAYTKTDQWTMVFDDKSRLVNSPDRMLIEMINAADAGKPLSS
ncbi:carboxylesterase/lipase family protein [Paenarthrobacter sp. NPDC091669]|uniref:carboxylesterase/lipase family protein n=1 Tax=Paenarthrobacter sp. NPDC091669 TaxID=3364384 RepID=UPI0038107BBB